jgi:SAM-dependent methyltransferase
VTTDDVLRLAPSLRRLPNGIFVTDASRSISYPDDGNRIYFGIEDDSFWFQHRNDLLLDALKRFPPAGVFVDVGGGNGYVTSALQDAGWDAILLEPGIDGVRNAKIRGVRHIVNAEWEEAVFPPRSLGAVGLFDVLEHIADDSAFVRSIVSRLMPGGRLYVTVPAHRWLWSFEDGRAGHMRRYTRKTLLGLVLQAGLEIDVISHAFAFLTLPIFLLRRLALPSRRRQEMAMQAFRDHGHTRRVLLRSVLVRLCAWERRLLKRGWSLPLGSSLLVVARTSFCE